MFESEIDRLRSDNASLLQKAHDALMLRLEAEARAEKAEAEAAALRAERDGAESAAHDVTVRLGLADADNAALRARVAELEGALRRAKVVVNTVEFPFARTLIDEVLAGSTPKPDAAATVSDTAAALVKTVVGAGMTLRFTPEGVLLSDAAATPAPEPDEQRLRAKWEAEQARVREAKATPAPAKTSTEPAADLARTAVRLLINDIRDITDVKGDPEEQVGRVIMATSPMHMTSLRYVEKARSALPTPAKTEAEAQRDDLVAALERVTASSEALATWEPTSLDPAVCKREIEAICEENTAAREQARAALAKARGTR